MVIETSNAIYNTNAYAALTPQSVLYWIRVLVASARAIDAPTWANHFSTLHSGTYNNQVDVPLLSCPDILSL